MKTKTYQSTQPMRLAAIGAVVLLGVSFMAPDHSESPNGPTNGSDSVYSIELAFKTHLDMGLAEQDVYLERTPGATDVWRATAGDHDMTAPLFGTASTTPHDPFNEDAVGPYAKGSPLGFTLGEWLRHQGGGTYTCSNGEGKLNARFRGLRPNGVYTMWHAFIAMPPPVPFTGTLDLPLGARDGSESVFRANGDGTAQFVHTFKPCLELSDTWTTSMLAINYHSDGRTYGGHPGKFGYNAHIPLFMMLPNRDGI